MAGGAAALQAEMSLYAGVRKGTLNLGIITSLQCIDFGGLLSAFIWIYSSAIIKNRKDVGYEYRCGEKNLFHLRPGTGGGYHLHCGQGAARMACLGGVNHGDDVLPDLDGLLLQPFHILLGEIEGGHTSLFPSFYHFL